MGVIRRTPWKLIRRVVFFIRVTLLAVARPEHKVLVVDASVEELKQTLKSLHFTSGWKFAYHYYGEDANLRRPEPGDDPDRWYHVHVRIFEREDGRCELDCHFELDPLIHPKLHLLEKVMRVKYGLHLVQQDLQDAGYVVHRTTSSTSDAN